MPTEDSFRDVMSRLRAGDDKAAEAVFQRFSVRLIALARSRLNPRIRSKEDAEDVAQSALKSFFIRYPESGWDLKSWESLWALLTTMTLRKVARRQEFYSAGKRDLAREEHVAPGPHDSDAFGGGLGREPTPAEAAMLAETLRDFFTRLGTRDRRVMELALQACSNTEIGAQVGCTQRTVQRVMERLMKRLQRLHESEEGTADNQ